MGTWYKPSNIMMFPYKRNEDQTIHQYPRAFHGDTFSMYYYQVIDHWGPERWEYEDTDKWQIHVDEEWKKSNVDNTKYIRNYPYWNEKEHTIENDKDGGIEFATSEDFRELINVIFEYQNGWQ